MRVGTDLQAANDQLEIVLDKEVRHQTKQGLEVWLDGAGRRQTQDVTLQLA